MPHPDTPPRAVSGVFFTYLWRNAGEWAVDFMVAAPPRALALAAPVVEPVRTDGLWKSTCFEVFLLDPSKGAYLEFNFAPSGQWAAYQFDGYRSGMRELEISAPQIFSLDPAHFEIQRARKFRHMGMDEETLEGLARPVQMPPGLPSPVPEPQQYGLRATLEHPGLWRGVHCHAALSAVIEEADGTKSYWALAHAPGKPDFHHADGFALEMPPAVQRKTSNR